MSKVVVVGAGAAGMMAAIASSDNGNNVTIIEKNDKLGKKLFITGKGRCNITNACDMDTLYKSVIRNPKFLFSAFNLYNNYDIIDFFENNGLDTKIERGGRVFPVSDHSSDVIRCLENVIKDRGIEILFRKEVDKIKTDTNGKFEIYIKNADIINADKVIIATGGMSYPSTGSTGDGYEFARANGHKVEHLSPSLVPFNIKENYVTKLQGLSLKNVTVTLYDDKKEIFSDFGEMLFTHFGVSGPLILTASSFVNEYICKGNIRLSIDLKPALAQEQLDKRILRDFETEKNKQFKNSINSLLPSKLIPIIIELSNIDPEKKVNEISKEERLLLVELIKNFKMTINGLRDYKEAIITKGGVNVKDINPKTMESKIVPGLFFAGEVLDVDAVTGGFNLQIAWSTGYAAGSSIYPE